jgi:hypothetical protein
MFGERRSPLTNVSGSSNPGIPAERDRQTIQDLHVAIERRTLLSGETKEDKVHLGRCTWRSRRHLVQEFAGAS